MAKRIFQVSAFTPTATGDGVVLANSTYMDIEAANATMGLQVLEIYEGGQQPASAINIMHFARNVSQVTTAVALTTPNSDGPMNSYSAALAAPTIIAFTATNGPYRSSVGTQARLNLSFNSFGGIVRWVAAPGEEWGITGVTASVSGSNLSSPSGSAGAMGAHIVYEPF